MNSKEVSKELFEKFEKNTLALIEARAYDNKSSVQEYLQQEQAILQQSQQDIIVGDCFTHLLIAEYKELIYESLCFPFFTVTENCQLEEYRRVLRNKYEDDIDAYVNLYQHKHDPEHIVFKDSLRMFMFYEHVEKKGLNIFNGWTKEW